MHELAAHPRLAHMLLAGRDHGAAAAAAAAELAALLAERDLLRAVTSAAGERQQDSDIRSRLDALRRAGRRGGGRDGGSSSSMAVDRGALERVRRAERAYTQQLGARAANPHDSPLAPGTLLAFAYPDRVGQRRAGADGRYQLASGRGAAFAGPESIAREEFVVAVHVDDRERDARILLAAPLARGDLLEHFGAELVREDEVAWDPRAEAVVARSTVRFGELVIDEKPLKDVPADAAAAAFVEGLGSLGIEALPWDDDARDLAARSEFVRHLERGDLGDWPDLSNEALAADLAWLEPFVAGLTRRSQLDRVPLAAALRARLTHEQQRRLDELAPTHVTLPTGTRARIDYRDDNAPVASMRMQEVFGLAATPKIGGGAVPVTFKLLSPAHRPLQVTRDLASFWRNAYVDVRKDMRGRYPRHYWPENPLEAEPTRRAKPRK
jgi:ATP-dependent helicase HrpB